MRKIEISILSFAALGVGLGLYISIIDPHAFRNQYVNEDGIIEWLTVVALVLCFLVGCKRLMNLPAQRPLRFKIMVGLLTAFCLFGAGEEISWGQRIFDIETPEALKSINRQEETNLHNLVIISDGKKYNLNKIIFGTGLAIAMTIYLAVLTPLYRRKPAVRDWLDNMAVPMPENHHIIAWISLLAVVELLVDHSKRGELIEFGGTWIFLLNVTYAYNAKIFTNKPA